MDKKDNEDETNKGPPLGLGDTPTPWLVLTNGSNNRFIYQAFSSIPPNKKFYIKSITELLSNTIQASYHGWLILRDIYHHNMYSLWNPITFESINLPCLPPIANEEQVRERERESCRLTSPPTCTNCVLLLFFGDQVFFCRPNTSTITWTSQRLELDGKKVYHIRHHVTLNGIIYSWTQTNNNSSLTLYLTTIEVVNDIISNLKSLTLMPPDCNYMCSRRINFLVESCGCIYNVNVYLQYEDDHKFNLVKLWKLNLLEREWVEVESLDGRAFFLGKDCCTWCWGSIGNVQGNCVYLLLSNIIYCYSLYERSWTLLCPCQGSLARRYLTIGVWVDASGSMSQHQRLSITPNGRQWNMEYEDNDVLKHDMINMNTISEIKQLPQDENADGEKGPFIELPQDMIQLIAKYTHMFDYWNFRASCTRFRSAIPPVLWRTNNSLPLFIFFKNDDGLCQVMDSSRHDSPYNKLRLSLNRLHAIDFSKDGWLIMHTRCKSYLLEFFNPFTKERVIFPFRYPFNKHVKCIGFSTYPTSPDCVTVAFDYISKEGLKVYYFQYGDESWKSCTFPCADYQFQMGTSSPIYFQGAFYVLDKSGKLGAFKLVNGKGKWKAYGNPSLRISFLCSYHLLECNGELLAIFIGFMGQWVEVFKINLCKEKWVRVESLGNYSLFVGKSSFSVKIADVGMRNRIYILRLRGNSMIFYSLETQKFHASKSDPITNFCNTSWHMDSFWL